MTDGFKLLGGHTIADAFRSNTILKSPVAILMIGIVVTAILQSSSTVTSIAVVMVGAEAFTVEQAYYVIMGSNVGTAVTSTIVALFSSGDRGRFEKAFAAAVIHDLYNWMGVVVLFPLEVITSALFGQGAIVSLTGLMVKNLELGTLQDSEFFQKIIDPFTHLIFQADDEVLTNRSLGIVTNQSICTELGLAGYIYWWFVVVHFVGTVDLLPFRYGKSAESITGRRFEDDGAGPPATFAYCSVRW
ncbi:Na+/Pi-cotransporter family protein [Trichinella spiralis]|uniref:Na+/Pi-cotransporter family protein n=1 Tax=Trichinella spiralis TaxID=6334 RepID=UPI0001EFBDAD|nr:Na+/Pi-cotransporter family protein [Trichinella spiralis]